MELGDGKTQDGGSSSAKDNSIDNDVSGATLPYFICIRSLGDFLKLEKFLRRQLQCQGTTCSFLQSADYAAVKIAATHALRGTRVSGDIEVPQIVCIPNSSLILCLVDNHSTIMIREQEISVPKTTATSAKKKRKCMADEQPEEAEGEPPVESSIDLSLLESKFVSAIAKQRQIENFDVD